MSLPKQFASREFFDSLNLDELAAGAPEGNHEYGGGAAADDDDDDDDDHGAGVV